MIQNPMRSPQTAVVFAQALTGLGHLRVSHALYHGLPGGSHSYLLNSQDESLNTMHRIMSIHPVLRRLMEEAQSGWFEDAFSFLARQYFRRHTYTLTQQLQTIVDSHVVRPKTLLVVATHTFLGHQIAAIKDQFSHTNGIAVILVVVVTDDSPQHVWAVGGADIIVVPSDRTKRNLEEYHRKQHDMKHSIYIVDPYMIDPRLGSDLPGDWFARKKHALNPDKLAPIHVSIPVSGAAVQLSYVEKLMRKLDGLSDRFTYHVTSLQSPSTIRFLNGLIGRKNITLHVSYSHREVVDLYERLYHESCISLELTKPSEQAFKALCNPKEYGGAILLFSDPVGRQEWDNIHFLSRHSLIPTKQQQCHLWRLARMNSIIEPSILKQAVRWRGLLMPKHAEAGAEFISWCLRERVFLSMLMYTRSNDNTEISTKGVETFWAQISSYLKSATS